MEAPTTTKGHRVLSKWDLPSLMTMDVDLIPPPQHANLALCNPSLSLELESPPPEITNQSVAFWSLLYTPHFLWSPHRPPVLSLGKWDAPSGRESAVE